MKKKFPALCLLISLLGFGVAGCQGAFEFNVISLVDNPTLPPASTLKTANLTAVKSLLGSDKNLELLKNDPASRTALTQNLTAVMQNGTAQEKKDAANLSLQLQLWGTGAGTATNNLVQVLLPALTGNKSTLDLSNPTADPAALQKALSDVFGTDPATIAGSLEGLQNMVLAYQTLDTQNSVTSVNGDYVLAAPLASLTDILLVNSTTTPQSQGLVDFISGKSSTLASFNTANINTQVNDLSVAVTGTTALPPTSKYVYMNSLATLLPLK